MISGGLDPHHNRNWWGVDKLCVFAIIQIERGNDSILIKERRKKISGEIIDGSLSPTISPLSYFSVFPVLFELLGLFLSDVSVILVSR